MAGETCNAIGDVPTSSTTISDEPKNTTIEKAISAAVAQGGKGGGMY